MASVQDQLEIKFRLTDGSDIGPETFPTATSVATLKESVLAQWPKEKENGPRTMRDVKLISAGKILENNKTLGECQSPICDNPGGVMTMHVIVQPPPEKAIDPLDEAAVKLKMEITLKPTALDEINRSVLKPEMERLSLNNDTDKASRDRLSRLEAELFLLKEKQFELTEHWEHEKTAMTNIQSIKEDGKLNLPNAKALASNLFNTEEALVRVDMSEYMGKHAVSRLRGAPPGYVGYEEERRQFAGGHMLVFQPLDREQINSIVRLKLERVQTTIADRKIRLPVTDSAVQLLGNLGYDPNYSARPVKRVIKQNVVSELAKGILRRDFNDEDTILVDTELTAFANGQLPQQKLIFRTLDNDSYTQANTRQRFVYTSNRQ
ncbi:hypothetical protein V6N13_028427 [Hibiscus sabdariffa]